jgi:hypothetical protein
MSSLITHPEQITPAWLTAKLADGGVLQQGAVESVSVVTPTSGQSSLSHTVVLAVAYTREVHGPVPRRLFLKISKPDLPAEICAWGRREVLFYERARRVAALLPVPRCYDAVYDEATARSHLLLDDVSATHFQVPRPLPPSPLYGELLVNSLARLHAQWWESARLVTDFGETVDEVVLQANRQRLEATLPPFLDFLGDALLPEQRRLYERILASPLLERRDQRCRTSSRVTLLHGDTHVGNCLLPRDPARERVIWIDWQLWEVNVAVDDLAYFMAHQWSPARRAAFEQPLLRHYHECLTAYGVVDYDWHDCWRDYRESVVLMTLVPIGQFRRRQPLMVLWTGLEHIMAAFQDLHCEELL